MKSSEDQEDGIGFNFNMHYYIIVAVGNDITTINQAKMASKMTEGGSHENWGANGLCCLILPKPTFTLT